MNYSCLMSALFHIRGLDRHCAGYQLSVSGMLLQNAVKCAANSYCSCEGKAVSSGTGCKRRTLE
jgi:hypothetical protein